MRLSWSPVHATAFRLFPGDDLKSELMRIAQSNNLQAASIISAVGSLSQVSLRFANCRETTNLECKHEILSLSGTLSSAGVHVHLSVADSTGTTRGGHLMSGSLIYTTAEIVVAEYDSLTFTRENCPRSGYRELVVGKRDVV